MNSKQFLLICGVCAVSLMAAGCSETVAGGTGPDTCGASAYKGFIGQHMSAVDISGHRNARFLRPNQRVHMDYREWRLNIFVDKKGVVINVRCG